MFFAKRVLFCFSLLFSHSLWAEEVGLKVNVILTPAGSFVAQTKSVTGSAKRVGAGVEAEGISIDLTGITTGIGLRDDHTKKHLMVAKYPKAKLTKATGKDGKGKATLELKGQKIDVEGTYKIEGNLLIAKFPVDLAKVDIKNVRYMGVGVKSPVQVQVAVPIK